MSSAGRRSGLCGVVARLKDQRIVTPVDLPGFEKLHGLLWHKRWWRCPDPASRSQIDAGCVQTRLGRVGQRQPAPLRPTGDVDLKIPKLRQGSFFPSILERRRRIDRALFAVVMEAYVHGVSTRKVDDLVAALGLESGISKSEVSRICAELDQQLGAFRARSLAHVDFPYVFLDATYLKGRVEHQVVSRAVAVATGVSMDGNREVFGCAVGHSEDGPSGPPSCARCGLGG